MNQRDIGFACFMASGVFDWLCSRSPSPSTMGLLSTSKGIWRSAALTAGKPLKVKHLRVKI